VLEIDDLDEEKLIQEIDQIFDKGLEEEEMEISKDMLMSIYKYIRLDCLFLN
jgi:hypothetical protein